jgi:hypothetical protein
MMPETCVDVRPVMKDLVLNNATLPITAVPPVLVMEREAMIAKEEDLLRGIWARTSVERAAMKGR